MIGAALLASLMWGTADFLAGRASRVHPAAMVALVGQAIGLVALALILLFRGADADARRSRASSSACSAPSPCSASTARSRSGR